MSTSSTGRDPGPLGGAPGVAGRSVPGGSTQSTQGQQLPLSQVEGGFEGEETRPLASGRHSAVSSLLADLAKTARSFTLYDPRNDAIRQFLASLNESLSRTLESEGTVRIDVQPFEMGFEGEVVYLNKDRDRSLAFRLYRDGVRCITIRPGFTWDELLELLQILSIRYVGVHQHEDDMVTLLWKANFQHMDVAAVEGFTPSEDGTPQDDRGLANGKPAGSDDVDGAMPQELLATMEEVPQFSRPYEPVAWVSVAPERLQEIRGEASDHTLPTSCNALLKHTCTFLRDPDAAWRFAEVSHLFAEVRDFLLAGERLPDLEKLVDMLDGLATGPPPPWDPGRRDAVLQVLSGCRERRAIKRLLHTTAVAHRVVPPELVRLVGRLCSDPVEVVMETLVEERSPAARALARQLLEHFGRNRVEELRARFAKLPGSMASDLLRVLAHIDLDNSAMFIARQSWHTDPGVQDEALWHLENIPYSGPLGRHLFEAACRLDPSRRVRVFKLILQSKDPRFVDRMARHIEQQGDVISPQDAEELGRVMGRLGGTSRVPLWKAWLTPAGWIRKILRGPMACQIAAAGALSEIRSEEVRAILEEAAACAKGSPVLEWIERSIERWEAGAGRKSK
ncbi:MAG: hypothetical protein AB1714_22010 [Acidobacteriota bacterium]